MFQNKKAQGMVIDLIMLIVISSVFFVIVSSQMSHQSTDAAVIRTKSMQIQRTLISLLNVRSDNTTTHQNATVAELIGEKYCEKENTFGDLNSTVLKVMKTINKPNYYFIFSFCPKDGCSGTDDIVCSPDVVSKFGKCCIKTENINVARLQLNIPKNCTYSSDKYAIVEVGIWPNNLEVEPCE